jgi:hypothetical protein
MKWDKEKEKLFKTFSKKTRKQQFLKFFKASLKEIKLQPFIRELQKTQTVKTRHELLSAFTNGDHLSLQQIKYMALTNSLLNSFLDQDFYQKALELLDKETLDNVSPRPLTSDGNDDRGEDFREVLRCPQQRAGLPAAVPEPRQRERAEKEQDP